MTMPDKKIIFQDGIILWVAYHFFDWLRQISVFQQIRNVSKWIWNHKFKKKYPNATKEEHDKIWSENRPFTYRYIFPELWVLLNILLSVIGCVVVVKTSSEIISFIFVVYAILRTFELFVYQINVLLFDPIKVGFSKYRLKSATRIVLLLMCNIFEYIFWFSVVYIFMYKAKTQNVDSVKVVLESVSTIANITSPVEFTDFDKGFDIAIIAYVESAIGIFMNIICLARFISLLPPVKTIDEN